MKPRYETRSGARDGRPIAMLLFRLSPAAPFAVQSGGRSLVRTRLGATLTRRNVGRHLRRSVGIGGLERGADLLESLVLDLPHALLCHTDHLPDLLERERLG